MWGQPPPAVQGRRPAAVDLDLELRSVGRTLLSDAVDFAFAFDFALASDSALVLTLQLAPTFDAKEKQSWPQLNPDARVRLHQADFGDPAGKRCP
jgi:hypothetical protein